MRKLDRKFSNKSKTNKIKWGMDALRFTVEKENKVMVVDEEKEVIENEADKSQAEIKNIDLVPKLNFSRAGNIPEFKVIQKNSFKNRFQKIIDNKLKRKSSRHIQQENETDEMETEVMLVPVVVKKKNKKQKLNKLKKNEGEKNIDVYDFNESESEGEPVVLSHIKKPMPIPTKLKLVKVKEAPSKNKADSTTKDLISDDYDSEDSLPLSIVKKSKPEEEDDDKDEKTSEDGVEKSEGILEQVEYLIEQLENETGSSEKKETTKEVEKEIDNYPKNSTNAVDKNKEKEEDSDDPPQKSLRVSLANKLLELQNLSLKNNSKILKNNEETSNGVEQNESKVEPRETILEEPESSQSTFDEEDSMPLVLMSKRIEETQSNDDQKKCEENTTDVSTTASEDVHLFEKIRNKSEELINCSPPSDSQPMMEENSLLLFPQRGDDCNKANKPFETLNGNVIYCRNESMSDFESDLSNDGLIDSNYEKIDLRESDKNFINKVTEKEDVIIVCSKSDEQSSEPTRVHRKKLKKKDNFKTIRKKKKRFPLLSATIEDNSFRKSEDLRVNKEVIVRKIWNRRKVIEDSTDYEEDSSIGFGINSNAIDMNNDESQTEVEKEIIVNKIWSRKKLDYESEFFEKPEEKLEDVKINKTEVSDEVVIKCGPKPITSPKRRKSKSLTNESSKETIMRKIWSGKCMFQTKAALKTYDSDVMPNCKENEIAPEEAKPRKRGRPAGFSNTKRVKLEEIDKDDQDDLDSLLEEIEREQLEKAIRLEFLQLRRSEKANVEIAKERTNPTIGLFTETSIKSKKDSSEKKKRKKMKRNLRHPRQSLLKRKKFIKKPLRRILPSEGKYFNEKSSQTNPELGGETRDNFLDKNGETFTPDSKVKSRKHKKHRHKHHHHKHKHKKSKHHKSLMSKHKSKYKSGEGGEEEEEDDDDDDDERRENADSFTILEKICQEIPNQIENELHRSMESNSSKMNEFLSPFSFEDSTKDCDEIGFEGYTTEKESSQNRDGNVYEFVEDASDYRTDDYKSRNSNYSND